jgi:sugar phosphate isomerase/epimerase
MGYEVVEFYSSYMAWSPATTREIRALLDDLGIACRSTHNRVTSFTREGLTKAIELNQILGSSTMVLASAPHVSSREEWKALGSQMTAVMETVRPLGMTCGFHNHQMEWRGAVGERPMDLLAASTPGDFVLQLDVGTAVEAGQDPVAWINAHQGRIKSVHCKDWSAGCGYEVAFGAGDVSWKDVCRASESSGGTEYFLIEQEVAGNGGELVMVRTCLDNWKRLIG